MVIANLYMVTKSAPSELWMSLMTVNEFNDLSMLNPDIKYTIYSIVQSKAIDVFIKRSLKILKHYEKDDKWRLIKHNYIKIILKQLQTLNETINSVVDQQTCLICNYSTHKKNNYDIHIQSEQHKKQIANPEQIMLEKSYECELCHKHFSTNPILMRHIRKNCLIANDSKYQIPVILIDQDQVAKIEEENKKLLEENKLLKSNQQSANNNLVINNQQNNLIVDKKVKLVAFGSENMSKISAKTQYKILGQGFGSAESLIDEVHFNPDRPENHNVYISNTQVSHGTLYNGSGWVIRNKTAIIDQLYDDKKYFLQHQYEKIKHKLTPPQIKRFEKFRLAEDDEPEIINIKNAIKEKLYNNRRIPMETKKKLEQLKN